MHPDYYRLLGVPSTATQPEIRSAYLALARRHHPDVNRAPGSADYFRSINAAYEVLGDPGRRAAYDAGVQRVRDERARRVYEARMRAAQARPPAKPAPTNPPEMPTAQSTLNDPMESMRSGRFVIGVVIVALLVLLAAAQLS